VASKGSDWDRDYQRIDDHDLACGELRRQVELDLKSARDNIAILDWIRIRSEDPEPSHKDVMVRTGLNVRNSKAGNWLLETTEFKSWVAQFRHGSGKSVFWLRGISKYPIYYFVTLFGVANRLQWELGKQH